MSSEGLLIQGGDVIDGTGAPRRRADVRIRDGRIAEIGPDLTPDGEQLIDANGAVVTPGFIDTHAHTDPQVFWDPRLDPDPLHGVTTMLVGNCSLSLYPASPETRGAISDLFAYIEDVPRHLFDDEVPWTWRNYDGYRDTVNAVGTGINLAALVGHSPLRLAVMGDDGLDRARDTRAAKADRRPLRSRYGRRRLGALHVLPGQRQGRTAGAVTGGGHGRVRRALRRHPTRRTRARGGRARTCSATGPRCCWKTSPAAAAPAASRSPGPVSPTPTAIRPAPNGGSTSPVSSKSEGIGFYPQLSPRTVDFRLNWDSSMMFMSMPQGWHKVIAARGAGKAQLLEDPGWRATAREEWDRTEKALFPHRRLDKVRFVEVSGAANQPWLGRTLAELVAERGGHPRMSSPTSCRERLPPGHRRRGCFECGRRGRRAHPHRPCRAHQLVRRRRAHADALRLGRHHADLHPARPRARRLHARASGLRADRTPGRGLRLHRTRRHRGRQRRRPRGLRPRRTPLRRRRVRRATYPATARGCAGPKVATERRLLRASRCRPAAS